MRRTARHFEPCGRSSGRCRMRRRRPSSAIPLVYWRILFPGALVGDDQGRVGEEQSGSLPGGFADSPGVGVRSFSGFLRECLGADAVAAFGGQGDGARRGNENFQTFQLLDPETNIRLGTRYLRQMLDRFGGVQEYALAAYNAGDNRVADWEAAGPYQGMDEFVESIPFTQTREYVEAILRNEETYRAIDENARIRRAGRGRAGAGKSITLRFQVGNHLRSLKRIESI